MIGLNMRYYRTISPGATKLIESGQYTAMRVPIDPTEIGREWVEGEWREWAKVPTLQRFTCVAPNYLEIDKIRTLDRMLWDQFGEKARLQLGNEPDWLSPDAWDSISPYPFHPPANAEYMDWLKHANDAIIDCDVLPPAVGCHKNREWYVAHTFTAQAWGAYLRDMSRSGYSEVCANIYPWDNGASATNQLASMRRQIAIAKHVAGILDVPLQICEIGRIGGKPVTYLCRGIEEVYIWGAGFDGPSAIYNLPGTEPVEVVR
jgi:hypothetical protein